MKKVAVIGGGLTGLVIALRLTQKGFKVVLLEKEKNIGGLARTFPYQNYQVPVAPHQFFSQDKYLLKLMKELKVKPSWQSSSAGIFPNKFPEILPFNKPKDLILFPLFNWEDKIKLGLFFLRLKFDKYFKLNYHKLANIDTESWLLKQTSPNLYSFLFAPLLRNKFAINPNQISAAWLATRLRDTLNTSGELGYFRENISSFLERFLTVLHRKKCFLKTNCEVLEIKNDKNRIFSLKIKNLNKKGQKKLQVDSVVSTIALPLFRKIASFLPSAYQRKISAVKYSSYLGGVLITKKPLTKYHITYFLNSPIGALNDFSNFYQTFPFCVTYVFKYLDMTSKLWVQPPEKVKTTYIKAIQKACGPFAYEDFFIFKEPFASPIFDLNFSKYKPDIKTPIKNLFISGMFNCYPNLRNLNSAIKIGEETAQIMIKDLVS